MVKIIDGEIVADDDPRVLQRTGQATQPTRQGYAQGATPAGSSHATNDVRAGAGHPVANAGFNLNAPPFRVLDDPVEQRGVGGLPSVEIFGFKVTSTMYIAMAGAFYMFGWKGLLAAGVLSYIYQANNANPPAPPGPSPYNTAANTPRAPVNSSRQAPPQAPQSPSTPTGSTFSGRSYKLGSN